MRLSGSGRPLFVLHGGPDFDHTYLVPGIDLLADSFRLICYDQRGRGRSSGDVSAISIASEIDDLDGLREHFGLDSIALLGHSWGAILGMEYALRHPDRVSHLILMNTAPASHSDYQVTRKARERRLHGEREALSELASNADFQSGDPGAVSRYYGLAFKRAVNEPAHRGRLNFRFEHFTSEGIIRAREIEDRLYAETMTSDRFDLMTRLGRVDARTLVIHGDSDFVPVECAAHVAEAIPGARLVVIEDCGHFAFVEAPLEVRRQVATLFQN